MANEMRKVVEFGQAKQSIRDLVKVDKITAAKAPAYVSEFVKKYRFQGFYKELLAVALDEINKYQK